MIRPRNPKQFMHISFVLLLFILFAATPVVLALMQKISVEDLTKEADVIVIGDIKEVESRWSMGRTTINTYVTLSVENDIKGGEGQETLTIITQGGSKWGFREKKNCRRLVVQKHQFFTVPDSKGGNLHEPGT